MPTVQARATPTGSGGFVRLVGNLHLTPMPKQGLGAPKLVVFLFVQLYTNLGGYLAQDFPGRSLKPGVNRAHARNAQVFVLHLGRSRGTRAGQRKHLYDDKAKCIPGHNNMINRPFQQELCSIRMKPTETGLPRCCSGPTEGVSAWTLPRT